MNSIEKRLIDANVMREDWLENGENEYVYDTNAVLNSIDAQPTVDAVPVVHGRWEDVRETTLYVPDMKYTVTHTAETCSVCKVRIGFIGSKLYLYDHVCPNCGADMRERKDNV